MHYILIKIYGLNRIISSDLYIYRLSQDKNNNHFNAENERYTFIIPEMDIFAPGQTFLTYEQYLLYGPSTSVSTAIVLQTNITIIHTRARCSQDQFNLFFLSPVKPTLAAVGIAGEFYSSGPRAVTTARRRQRLWRPRFVDDHSTARLNPEVRRTEITRSDEATRAYIRGDGQEHAPA